MTQALGHPQWAVCAVTMEGCRECVDGVAAHPFREKKNSAERTPDSGNFFERTMGDESGPWRLNRSGAGQQITLRREEVRRFSECQ